MYLDREFRHFRLDDDDDDVWTLKIDVERGGRSHIWVYTCWLMRRCDTQTNFYYDVSICPNSTNRSFYHPRRYTITELSCARITYCVSMSLSFGSNVFENGSSM